MRINNFGRLNNVKFSIEKLPGYTTTKNIKKPINFKSK
jgi:hypothetical protein